jgi:hypothetical protein
MLDSYIYVMIWLICWLKLWFDQFSILSVICFWHNEPVPSPVGHRELVCESRSWTWRSIVIRVNIFISQLGKCHFKTVTIGTSNAIDLVADLKNNTLWMVRRMLIASPDDSFFNLFINLSSMRRIKYISACSSEWSDWWNCSRDISENSINNSFHNLKVNSWIDSWNNLFHLIELLKVIQIPILGWPSTNVKYVSKSSWLFKNGWVSPTSGEFRHLIPIPAIRIRTWDKIIVDIRFVVTTQAVFLMGILILTMCHSFLMPIFTGWTDPCSSPKKWTERPFHDWKIFPKIDLPDVCLE